MLEYRMPCVKRPPWEKNPIMRLQMDGIAGGTMLFKRLWQQMMAGFSLFCYSGFATALGPSPVATCGAYECICRRSHDGRRLG